MPRGLRAVSTTGLAVLIGLAAAGVALPAARDPERLPVTRVQDLHYGDVLFYFYQDESFEALTRLEAYGQWQRMPHHDAEAALLAGGLYLQLGMHNEAGKRFETLLGPGIPAGVRNRAWFYLAKVWYARGYYDKAEQSLAQIQGRLVAALEAERQHLLANTLMRLGRFDDAIRLLQGWHGPADWMAYARFNLGVALVRSGRTAEADPFLTQAGTFETSREELLALKDKANLALGYAWLQANEPAKAKLALERVRLDGSQSTRALLGAGWADAALEQYRDALGPWLELHGRDMLDAAVQESFLAVPYAFAKLNANAQASEYYEQAIRSFDEESQRIDAAVGRIESGNMLEGLLAAEPREAAVAGPRGNGWFWQLEQLPDAPESRYLYALLADNDFQEGLKNYRDLRYLGGTLARWDDNMSAYGNMLEARETSFAQELPRTDALLASERLQRLESGRTALDTRLAEVVAARDVAGLGTPEERQQWRKIQALEQELATRPEDAETTALRDKLRLAKGVLFFRLDADYKQRLWQQRRTLKQLDAALAEARSRWTRLQEARRLAPQTTAGFATRIAALQERLTSLRAHLVAAGDKQNEFLEQLAVRELRAQQQRLDEYRLQARFALATIYDRAANEPEGGAAPSQAEPLPQQQAAPDPGAAPGVTPPVEAPR